MRWKWIRSEPATYLLKISTKKASLGWCKIYTELPHCRFSFG